MSTASAKRNSTGFIGKMLVCTAAVLAAGVVAAAPVIANPEPSDTHPVNPFEGLTCSCQGPAPTGGNGRNTELDRGILAGLHSQALSTQPIQ
jgi:hypothetical protein